MLLIRIIITIRFLALLIRDLIIRILVALLGLLGLGLLVVVTSNHHRTICTWDGNSF